MTTRARIHKPVGNQPAPPDLHPGVTIGFVHVVRDRRTEWQIATNSNPGKVVALEVDHEVTGPLLIVGFPSPVQVYPIDNGVICRSTPIHDALTAHDAIMWINSQPFATLVDIMDTEDPRLTQSRIIAASKDFSLNPLARIVHEASQTNDPYVTLLHEECPYTKTHSFLVAYKFHAGEGAVGGIVKVHDHNDAFYRTVELSTNLTNRLAGLDGFDIAVRAAVNTYLVAVRVMAEGVTR